MKRITQKLFCGLFACIGVSTFSFGQFAPGDFINPVPIPNLATGTTNAGVTSMEITSRSYTTHSFDPMGSTTGGVSLDPSVTTTKYYDVSPALYTWGINSSGSTAMDYLGSTLKWKVGNTIDIQVKNELPSNSTTTPGEGQTTTSHWHGLNIYSQGDGGPHQAIPNTNGGPGGTVPNPWNPQFEIVDDEQTLWYHSHVMDFTTEQVILGSSGIIIIEDTTDAQIVALNNALPNEYGVNDFPIIIQDKPFNFRVDTISVDTILYTATSLKAVEKPGDGQFRTVNGVINGVLNVPPSMVRLRILDGDSRKSFAFAISTNIDTSNHSARIPFHQIATDGGYKGNADTITKFLVNPGERGEFVVDFSGYANGTELYLSNISMEAEYYDARDIVGLGGDASNGGPANPGLAFMKFVVDNSISVSNPVSNLPAANMWPTYALQNCPTPRLREKRLMDSLVPPFQGNGGKWTIDGEPMDMMKLNDTVCANTCEEWTIYNETPVAHPFHIHKVQFQIKEYVDRSVTPNKVYTFPNLPSEMMGYKDVMIVRKLSEMTFQARFDMFGDDTIAANRGYMYHCHILTHEDFSMMHQFAVVNDSICNIITGKEQPKPGANFQLYPNPAGDMLYLDGMAKGVGSLRIVDLLGRELATHQIQPFDGKVPISVADVPRGLVLVEYRLGNLKYTEKILLQ